MVMGHLQLSDHVAQNLQTGEQVTPWDMLNKATKFEFFSLTFPSALFALQFGDCVPRDRSAANGPFNTYQLLISLVDTKSSGFTFPPTRNHSFFGN